MTDVGRVPSAGGGVLSNRAVVDAAEPDPLDVLTEAWEKKTPGPWVFATDRGAPDYVQLYSTADIDEYEADVLSADGSDVLVSEKDADFIAAAGTHVGTLLRRLKAAEEVRETLTRRLADPMYHDPDGDLTDAVRRVRLQSQGCPHCTGRHRCPYHEGWDDALDALEDALS